MTSHNEGVNPLRPYYIPPTIGEPIETLPTPDPRAFSHHAIPSSKYASKARDIFPDIDYKDYITEPSPSVVQSAKDLLDELLWKYMSVFMAQPFEVAKTIMQVRSQDDLGGLAAAASASAAAKAAAADQERQRQAAGRGIHMYADEALDSDDSDADEMSYFTSNIPHTPTSSQSRSQRSRQPSPPPTPRGVPPKAVPAHQLALRTPNSVLEVIAQLWQKEGAWGVWKANNATFIYSVLQSLLENWSRSLLSALLNVPDLGVRNDMDRLVDIASPYPWASLCVAAAAAVATGLILAPLDLIRTRLIITSTLKGSRRTLSTLRNLPSYLCPSPLIVPTILNSLVHPILMLSTPLVLRSRFMIDKEVSPVTFSIAKFCSSTVALFVKLPLETVLRRGQAAVLSSPQYMQALHEPTHQPGSSLKGRRLGSGAEQQQPPQELETIVPVGSYNGVFGTMYIIVNEEGSHALPLSPAARSRAAAASRRGGGNKPGVSETVYRRGQGLDGLWRGWKVSWWGLVGLWTAGVIGGGGDGEF